MEFKYYPPTFGETSFHCPHCNVFSSQRWGDVLHNVFGNPKFFELFRVSHCNYCKGYCLWHEGVLTIPSVSSAPMPHKDMPESMTDDYNEARNIVNFSPRGAAALLRLTLQKLMTELGESGRDINKDIGSLVKKGLPEEVQQALDIVRVIGNESVHPGELDLRDDVDTAHQLFDLINFIVEERISRPKKLKMFYERLPEGKRRGIEDRDRETSSST